MRLRQYKISDLKQHINLLIQNEVYPSRAVAIIKESAWFNKAILNYKKPKPDFYVLAITVNKKVIGNVIVEKIYRKRGANIGIWIGKSYWGKGYATKALNLFLSNALTAIFRRFLKFIVYSFFSLHPPAFLQAPRQHQSCRLLPTP